MKEQFKNWCVDHVSTLAGCAAVGISLGAGYVFGRLYELDKIVCSSMKNKNI